MVAFSADFVTGVKDIDITRTSSLDKLTLASSLVSLVDRFDDTDSDGLPHVTDGESTKWRVLIIRFNTSKPFVNSQG